MPTRREGERICKVAGTVCRSSAERYRAGDSGFPESEPHCRAAIRLTDSKDLGEDMHDVWENICPKVVLV